MTFDAVLFHTLFKNLYQFHDFIGEDELRGGARVEDNSGGDITACFGLSIFPQLRNIAYWGENVVLTDYVEIKDGKKIVGARGVIVSGMDWCDIGDPTYYYEFAHLERDGEVEEYVRELHIDDVVMQVWGHLDKKPGEGKKGSDESRALIAGAIERCDGLGAEIKAEIRYRCLIDAEHFEVWKIGFPQGSYGLWITAPQFICGIDSEAFIEDYLRGVKMDRSEPIEPLDIGELEQVRLRDYEGSWYHMGAIDIDPELTKMDQAQADAYALQELADTTYCAVLSNRFGDINFDALPEVLPILKPNQIAQMRIATVGTEMDTPFIEACKQHCPDKFREAYGLIKRAGRAEQ